MIRNILILISLILTGCAGPLINHETARTMGGGNVRLNINYMPDVADGSEFWGLVFDVGILEKLDLGLQIENLAFGIKAKYAFIRQPQKGFSLAGILGTGSTWGGSYWYGTVVGSYLVNKFEPFAGVKKTTVKVDTLDLRSDSNSDIFLVFPNFKYSYMQIFFGTKYWFTKTVGLTLEGSSFADSSDVEFSNDFLISAGFDFRFD